MSKFKQLVALDVSRCALLTDDALTTVRRQLNILQELNISECRHVTTPVLCQVWKDCTRLHSLTARACPAVTDAFLQCVATTQRAPPGYTLKHLDVRQCKFVTSSGVSYLATSSLKGLATVSLSIGDCLDVGNMAFFGFETSTGLAHLRALNLCGLHIDETAMSWIVKGCRALEHLNLARCKTLTDFALLLLAPLVQSNGKGLVSLNLKECPLLTDTGVRNLFSGAEEARKQRIKAATCSGDNDNDDDENNGTSLTTLNLKNCALISDASIAVVSHHCPHLVKLNVKGLRKLSDQSVMHLGKSCPHLASLKLSRRYISTQSFQVIGKLLRQLDALDVSERQDLESPLCILQLTASRATATPLHQSLRQLNLSATNVCDVGVSMIAVHCRQLEWLNLSKVRFYYLFLSATFRPSLCLE